MLKATHAPLIGGIWAYERWETFALRREAAERAALSFGFDSISASSPSQQPTPVKTKTNSSTASKRHSLKNTRKFQVPSALISKASKRSSKQAGAAQDTSSGRVNTAPAAVQEEPPSAGGAGSAPVSRVGTADTAVGVAPAAQALPTADVAEMMRLLKELSAQVEEVRSALVKHDQGAVE